jgi:TRAP transporter TAXI family solute receptor
MRKKPPPKKPTALFIKDHISIFGPAILLTIIGFFVAFQFVQPAPPTRIVMATGDKSGAYHLFGKRYQTLLAQHRITLVLRNTSGSVENLQLLKKGEVDIAFVQGGVRAFPPDTTTFTSLASLYYEPIWIFSRALESPEQLTALRGKRIAAGAMGSGTRAIALQLLSDNDMLEAPTQVLTLNSKSAAKALEDGQIDAMVLVTGAQSPLVKNLVSKDGVSLMNFRRAEAYTRHYRFLSKVELPEGMIDLEANVPQQDTLLLACVANLVVREGLHPALIDLLLQAATKVHGEGGLFEKSGEFPSAQYLSFSLHPEAQRYFDYGPPFLQRYLPFWAATLIDRLKIMLLPLLALLIPLAKAAPALYTWRMRARIYRWYDELQAINLTLRDDMPMAVVKDHLRELDKLEIEVSRIPVPLSYNDILYNLLLHLDLVRSKLQKILTNHPQPNDNQQDKVLPQGNNL